MMRFLRPAVLFLLVSAQAAAAGSSLPEGMTMHRKGAGKPDASGWISAGSTRGGFTVQLPLKFNDFTMRMPATDANVAWMFGVGAKSSEGVKFVAQRILYRSKELAEKHFSRIESGEALRIKGATRRSHRYRGNRAVDVSLENGKAFGHLRYIKLDQSLMYLIVEVPRKHRALVSIAMVQRFLDSIRVSRLDPTAHMN